MEQANLYYVTLSELKKKENNKIIPLSSVVFKQSYLDGTIAVCITKNIRNAGTFIHTLDNYMIDNYKCPYYCVKKSSDEVIDEYYRHFKRANKCTTMNFPRYLVTDEKKLKNVYFTTGADLKEYVAQFNREKRAAYLNSHSSSIEETLVK